VGGFQTEFGVFGSTIFLAGTLTEKILYSEKISTLRISDPTGVFTLSMNWQNTDLMQTAEKIDVPAFVLVTGTVKFRIRAGKTYPQITPDIFISCDRSTRDAWLCGAAADATTRLEKFQVSPKMHEFAAVLIKALENIRNDPSTAAPAAPAVTDEQLLAIIIELSGRKGAPITDVVARAKTLGMGETEAKAALAHLMEEGECYTPTTELIHVV
jgi:RPA family protein